MDKFLWKLVFLKFFVKMQCCYKLLQFINILRIKLFICASISQHNESLKCYALLFAHFNHKIFFIHLNFHIINFVMEMIKLLLFIVYIVPCKTSNLEIFHFCHLGKPFGSVGNYFLANFHTCRSILESWNTFTSQSPFHVLALVASSKLWLWHMPTGNIINVGRVFD
jgi:hypothetical protein